MSLLAEFTNANVSVLTNDGRIIIGTLRGFDNLTNIVLERCSERIFSEDEGIVVEELGLMVLRGDQVAVIGTIDAGKDAQIDFAGTKVTPLKPIVH